MPHVVVPRTPIPERHGRIVIDTTDGPMRVTASYDPSFVPPGGRPAETRSGELCTTPCVLDMPQGRYRLYFSAVRGGDPARGDRDDVIVSPGVQIYRRSPGLYRTPTVGAHLGPAGLVLLGTLATIGGTLLVLEKDSRVPGIVLLGVGTGSFIGGGIWAYDSYRAERQEGSTAFWHINPPQR